MQKKFDAWRCTTNGAVDTVQIVKCGWSKSGRCGFDAQGPAGCFWERRRRMLLGADGEEGIYKQSSKV
jgi:hypothetical protein